MWEGGREGGRKVAASVARDRSNKIVDDAAWAEHGEAWHGMLYNKYDGGGGGPYLHDDGQSIPPTLRRRSRVRPCEGSGDVRDGVPSPLCSVLRCAALRKRRSVTGEQ